MAKKLKSLNPIIGTGYKTLSTIKDGEDGNIENFPDTLPKIPRLSYKRLGVSGLEIGWEFEDKIYYTYELYGSTTKGFEASEENLMFQGLASSYFYEAKPGEKWYFKARAKNTHGRYTEFSSELVTYTVKLDNLGEYVEGGSINGALIENATINNAHIKDLHADKITAGDIDANRISASVINAINANISNATIDSAKIGNLSANKITAGVLDADRIGANSITANKIEANAITTEKIQANAITTDKLAANIIASNHIQSGTITSGHIQSGTIESGHIKAGTIESDHIKSNSINSNHIQANTIQSEHIQANTIQSEHIQTGAITAGSGIIAEGAIGSAQISSLDAAKIEAGTIDTSKVTIQGTNGHLKIKGNRLQVFNGTGSNAKERVSLGDVNGNGSVYGLRVRGADGRTVLLDENGVKSEGITDGAITNDKISDDANIDGTKLNINSVVNKINEDGTETIQGTKIEVDGTTLNTKLSTITTKQTEDSERISQAQSQITANTNAIKLKVDEQTYTTDKKDMTSKLEKNTSEISAMKGQIALKVEQTDIENAKSEMEGVIDTKVDSAKAEIKVTTDAISQNVSNLSQTVSTKADGSTVTTLSNKVGSLETSVNGISGKVTNLEKTTTNLGNSVSGVQGEVETLKSDVASLEVTTSGISQKVSSVESTTASLSTQVTTAQNTANSAQSTANSANSKIDNLNISDRNLVKNSDMFITTGNNTDKCTMSDDFMQLFNNNRGKKISVSLEVNATNALSTNTSGNKRIGCELYVTFTDDTYGYIGVWQQLTGTGLNLNKKRINATYTIPDKDIKSVGSCGLYIQGLTSGTVKIGKPKYQLSDKSSDWTPAPEDIDSNLNDVKNSLNSFQNTVNTTFKDGIIEEAEAKAIAQHLKTLDAEKADIDKEYSVIYGNSLLGGTAKTNLANAKTSFDSAHSSLKSTINTVISDGKVTSTEKASVDSTFTTYNSVLGTYKQRIQEALDAISSTKVNNVQVGGRNLALGTGKATGDVSSGHNGSPYSATDLFSGITAIKTNTAWSGRHFNLKAIARRGGFKAGDSLVLSVYIKADQNVTLRVTSHRTTGTGNTGGSSKVYDNFTVTPKWQQVWFPFVADEGSLNREDTRIEVNVATGSNYIHWAGWKLEKGTKPTDWTPAPEDVDSAINSVDGKVTTLQGEYNTTKSKVATLETNLDGITQRVSSTESTTSSLTSTVNNIKSPHGLPYTSNLIIYGDSDKYYPVYIMNGNQDVLRTIKIWRAYSEQAPSDWHTESHKGSLMLTWQGNFGGWGGASYKEYILENSSQYTVLLADCTISVHSMGYTFFLRGGGTTGALYHFASDQAIDPKVYYNGANDLVYNHAEDKYDVYAYEPKTSVNTTRLNNLKLAKESSVSSVNAKLETTNSKVSSIETNLNSITSRVSATETTTSSLTTQMNNKENKNDRVIYAKGNGNDAPNNSQVKVGSNTLVNGHGRGLNILALNPITLEQYYNGRFDTYGGDNYRTQFAEKIQELNNGNYIIVVTSHDSACLNYDTVCNALYLIGGSAPNTSISSYREAYALIGKSKLGKGNGLEMYIPKTATDARVAEVSVKVSDQGALLGVNSNNSESKIDTLTTRVSTAESKLTKDSLTTTIGNHYTTSTDVNGIVTSKGYATTSEVKQTTNELTATFKGSGGYNLLYNGNFKRSFEKWANTGATIANNLSCPQNQTGILLSGALTTTKHCVQSVNVETLKPFTVSFWQYTSSAGSDGATNPYRASQITITYSDNTKTYHSTSPQTVFDTWELRSITIKPTKRVINISVELWNRDTTKSVYYTNVMLEYGSIYTEWSPNPNEVYDGVTTIDKDGIKVSQSNYNGYTQMKADGFYVNNGSENVISVTSSGATFKGKVTIQSGSSVPTSTLSGTISSNQLNSSITSDINNAKNNASSALSTANTASTNATNALNTANSVNSTVNSNKDNWSNAYNRVKEWASGAVTGTTNINGGMIATDTITAKQMAIGDFNNYSQLAKGKNLVNRFGTANWTEGTNGHSYWQTTNAYFPFTVNETLNPFKAGDKIQIKFDAYTPSTRNVSVGVWFYSDTAASTHIGNVTADVSCSSSWGTKTVNLTLPTGNTYVQNAKSIAILIYNGSSGERIEVRNATVNRLVAGDLIVNGTITTDHIHTNGLNANVIKAGTISADRLDANTIVSKVNGGTTEINGNRIQTGTLSASKITTGTLDASKVNVTNLNASNIKSGTISADRIASNSITADKIAAGAITANKIASGAITATMITSGTLDASKVNVTNLNASNIKSGTISGDRIKGGTLSATNEINFVGGARIFGNSGAYDAGLFISAQQHELMHGNVYIGENLNVSKGFKVTGTTTLNGTVTCNALNSNGQISAKGLSITGNAGVSNQLNAVKLVTNGIDVYGYTNLDGNVHVSGNLGIVGDLSVRNKAIYGMNNIALARGTVYLPQGGGNNTTDYLRIGGGFMAGVDSGNFHFLNRNGGVARIYAGNVSTLYSLASVAQVANYENRSIFDEINSVNVVDTEEGLRLIDNHIRLLNEEEDIQEENVSKAVYTTYNEKTKQEEVNIDYTTAISTLWKAVQELKQENDELKEIIKDIHSKL